MCVCEHAFVYMCVCERPVPKAHLCLGVSAAAASFSGPSIPLRLLQKHKDTPFFVGLISKNV